MMEIKLHDDSSTSTTSEDAAAAQSSGEQREAGLELQLQATRFKHPDVDGGWAFVVLGAMFCSFFINSGLLSTVGVYYVQMLEYFGEDRFHTSWMGSLMNAFILLAGPVSSYFLRRWGTQMTMSVGAIIMTAGLYVSAFTPSLEIMFFTFGVVVACGMNFVYTSQISALNIYFDKYQYIATALSMVGIGMGVFFVNIWTEYNIAKYGWRGSFIWNAGLSLQLCVFGALVYPLHYPRAVNNADCRPSASSTHSNPFFLNVGSVSSHTAQVRLTAVSTLTMSAEASYASNYFNLPDTFLESTWHVFNDICFWLLSIAFFFAMLATTSVFIIYKDFVKSRGFAEQYSLMLIGFGVGDVSGRLSMGIAHNSNLFNPVWSYSVVLFLTGLVLMGHALVMSVVTMHIFGTLFGMVYGAQNVLIAIAPVQLFGKERLVLVFCYLLFFGGIGALIGAPIAGTIVDKSGSYNGVLGVSLASLSIGSVLLMVCAHLDSKSTRRNRLL